MSAPQLRPQYRQPALPGKTTPEIRYWRGFKSPLLVKEHNAISHIHFSPASPHDFVITSGTRVQIFSAKTRQVAKTISRFKDTVYSAEFRSDGRIVGAGDASGLVQLFDTQSKAVLVTLKPSAHPTHVTTFHPLKLTSLLSASDDGVARLWDITDSSPVAEFKGHGDYVRSATFVPGSDLVATGCYDSKVRLFDARDPQSTVAVFDQDAPVEAVLALNSSTILSAGGPKVKVWDLTAGRMVTELGNFQKTVTSLSHAHGKGVLASSLDGHVKVFDSSSPGWDVQFGWKFGGAVLSAAVAPDHKHFVAGLTSGLFAIRTRKTAKSTAAGGAVDTAQLQSQLARQPKSANFARMIRGAEYHGETEHRIVDDTPVGVQRKLRTYEKHLNAFRWGDALDSAFAPGTSAQTTLTVLNELRTRGKIAVSLAGRDEDSLEPVLTWATRAVADSRSTSQVADWVGAIVDMYGGLIDRSSVLETLVQDLRRAISTEVEVAKDSQRLQGMMQMLMA